jgi:hypothetical protein
MVGIQAVILVGLLFAAFTVYGAQVPEAGVKMETLVDKALNSKGSEYFEAERAYRLASGLPPLSDAVFSNNTDPLSQLILHVLAQWKQPAAQEFDQAVQYLDGLPARIAKTPITSPSPTGIVGYLSLHFGSRVADLLAVHLIKQTNWPQWRVSGVLLYLRGQPGPSDTAALIRFAAEARDKKWVDVAVETIRAANDPDLQMKLRFEETHATRERRPLPPSLRQLMNLQ